MMTIAKCISSRRGCAELNIINSGNPPQILSRTVYYVGLQANHLYFFETNDDEVGVDISTWEDFSRAITGIQNFTRLGIDEYEKFLLNTPLHSNSILCKLYTLIYGQNNGNNTDAIVRFLNQIDDTQGEFGQILINQSDDNYADFFHLAYYQLILAYLKKNNRIDHSSVESVRNYCPSFYENFLDEVWAACRHSPNHIPEAIAADSNFLRHAKSEEDKLLCIKYCLESHQDIILSQFHEYNAHSFQVNNLLMQRRRIEDFIEELKSRSFIFDIEGNGEGHTWEYAYKFGDVDRVVSHERMFSERGSLSYLTPIDWADFYKAIQNRGIIIGHNIKEWDCKMILERFEVSPIVINHDKIWDTLEIEVLLHPDRKYYALNANNGHQAKNDVITTEKLFWNQIREILSDQDTYNFLKDNLPAGFNKLVEDNSQYLFREESIKLMGIEHIQDESIFYIPASRPRIFNHDICNSSSRTLIVASELLWSDIADEIPSVCFPYCRTTIDEYSFLDLEKIKTMATRDDVYKKALGRYSEQLIKCGEKLRYNAIPYFIRKHIGEDTFRSCILSNDRDATITCVAPDDLNKLKDKSKFEKAYIVDSFYLPSYAQERDEIEYTKTISSLESYSEFKKNLRLDSIDKIGSQIRPYCKNADYYVYQPSPKELFTLYTFDVDNLVTEVKEIAKQTIIIKGQAEAVLNRAQGLISNPPTPDLETSPYEDERTKYWCQQIALFEAVPRGESPNVLVVNSNSEIRALTCFFGAENVLIKSEKEQAYKVIDRLLENPEKIGILQLSDLLFGAKVFFDAEIKFFINSLSFLNEDCNLKGAIGTLSQELGLYGKDCLTYILDPRIETIQDVIKIDKQLLPPPTPNEEERVRKVFFNYEKLLKDTDEENLMGWIKSTWGFEKLYDIQQDAISKQIRYTGSNNTFLTVLPTGKGKSVIFQGPLLYKAIKTGSNKLSIVITPLQALMKNQVEDLLKKLILNEYDGNNNQICDAVDKLIKEETLPYNFGGDEGKLRRLYDKYRNKIAYINSQTSAIRTGEIKKAIKNHELVLLYIAPERLMYRSFYNFIEKEAICKKGIDTIIFDEAHCITGWGMDFRPDYVLAARKCKDIQRRYPEVSIQLFTATLPEQSKLDLFEILPVEDSNILPTPGTEEFELSLCPIRDHIEISLEKVDNTQTKDENDTIPDGIIARVCDILKEKTLFDSLCNGKSRAVVFTKRRDDAEECARRLNDMFFSTEQLKGKINYFHAGRSKKDKDAIIKDYENGAIRILCSTKAFGLGMNIPNIHSVIHLTPPSYIEDYLQEVGRAGRNDEIYREVFGEGNKKIQATCLYTPADMERTAQQLKDEELLWDDVKNAFNKILEYSSDSAGRKGEHSLIVPLNLSKHFHQCLGWLSDEKGLNRIHILFRSPFLYQLEVIDAKGISQDSSLGELVAHINKIKADNNIAGNIVGVPANSVFEETSINNINELEEVIREGVNLGVISRDSMLVSVSFRRGVKDEVERLKEDSDNSISVLSKMRQALLDREEFSCDSRTKKIIESAWNFFNQLNLIYSSGEIEECCKQLLMAIFDCGGNAISWGEVKQAVNAKNDPRKAQLFLAALAELKLVNLGETCSDFIEIEISNDIAINEDCERDIIAKDSLAKFNNNRILKNDAMYAMIDSFQNSEDTKSFIRKYSQYSNDNLEKYDPIAKYSARLVLDGMINNNEVLNDEQKKIYNLSNKTNIFVSAGAGSGKTRLLTYRALKLILGQSGISESDVLILAYNRAVADEVSRRMDEYASSVHYVLRNKNIYTFHGFACKHLPYLLEQKIAFDTWETELLDDILNHPLSYKKYRHILVDEFQDVTSTRLQIIRELIRINNATTFVIGDMAQSIYGYEKKADVKKRFSNRGIEYIRKFAVIRPDKRDEFDEFNNEVAWDRIKECVSIDPSDYHLIDGANEQTLKNNYRSYQTIINTSVRWFEGSKLGTPELISQVHDSFEPPFDSCICPMPGADWIKDLVETILPTFLQNRKTWEKTIKHDDEQINPFTTVCILFRTNSDVHDAYSKLKQVELQGEPKVIIQGTDIFYQFTQEFFFFSLYLDGLKRDKPNSIIEDDCFISEYKKTNENEEDGVLEVAKQTASIIIKNNPGLTYSKLYEEFVRVVSEERNRLKDYIDRQHDSGFANYRIVLSTIHRVKGMEYDAVVVPASTYPIDLDYDDLSAGESNEEERRLMYVAFSRAKRMLYYYEGEREKAIIKGKQYEGEQNKFYAQDGLSAVDISFAAQNQGNIEYYQDVPDNSFFAINKYIKQEVHANDELILKRKDNERLRDWQRNNRPSEEEEPDDWCIYHGEKLVGRLSSKNKLRSKLNTTKWEKASGLSVKAICVCGYNDLEGDYNNGEQIVPTRQWSEDAKKQGYVYYIDYYGCAKKDE